MKQKVRHSVSTVMMVQLHNPLLLFIQAKTIATINKLNNIITNLDTKAPCGDCVVFKELLGVFYKKI